MKDIRNKKKIQIMIFVFIGVITLGVGYAAISAINLVISGNATGTFNQENFKVKFTTAAVTTGTGEAGIDRNDPKIATFDVTGLTKVGDTAVASYTVLNDSNGIGTRVSLNLTNSNIEYFNVTETIADAELQAGESTAVTITVTMVKTPIESAVTTSITGILTASPLENNSATGNDVESISKPGSFSEDSWNTIIMNVKNHNISDYHVGDTKNIELDLDGNGVAESYTLRIANKSMYDWCEDENYSQTACGFVIEFFDVVKKMKMHDTATNYGGYPVTDVYNYLKNQLFYNLPNSLQNGIDDTRVISGHGNNVEDNNYISTDKLYLFSMKEIYNIDQYDSSASTTRQLDLYFQEGTSNSSPHSGGLRKFFGGSYTDLWLRGARADTDNQFTTVGFNCFWAGIAANGQGGVCPAFRLKG